MSELADRLYEAFEGTHLRHLVEAKGKELDARFVRLYFRMSDERAASSSESWTGVEFKVGEEWQPYTFAEL